MKYRVLFSLVVAFIVTASCSSETVVKTTAEKALRELGNGKYAGEYYGSSYINFAIIDIYKSPYFGDYEERNIEAEKFISSGITRYDSELKESLFETDILFNDIVFVDIQQLLPLDIFKTRFLSTSKWGEREDFDAGDFEQEKKAHASIMKDDQERPGFFSRGNDYCYIEYTKVPHYRLLYKLDNKYLATVSVVKIKGEEPKVTSVYIRKQ